MVFDSQEAPLTNSAIPTAALPAPKKTILCSGKGVLLSAMALIKPARETAAVPWISSLKVGYFSRCVARRSNASSVEN